LKEDWHKLYLHDIDNWETTKTLCWTAKEERRKADRNFFSHLELPAICPHLHATLKNQSFKHIVIGKKIYFFLTFLVFRWRLLLVKRWRRSIFWTIFHLFLLFFLFSCSFFSWFHFIISCPFIYSLFSFLYFSLQFKIILSANICKI